ncbi:hypothetical protein K437DRAFT_137744 [Tilletiaria anomala UBC 951]|uniref:Uncharacterized protein n=1 Tax=Tilletiaria anomala (strain ATCC 24038 / CBS 436.72 / UBC 951) TaxID=1037660 RepID=A0A066W148_TILAU|nr:uncharacterized protein K437DRAFT_137744 [Tilletiaria anomala UBC 951]KDN44515.1 hypothetical protein K437DRAFT_137744 [Tilletiaria anomala UBC 951]
MSSTVEAQRPSPICKLYFAYISRRCKIWLEHEAQVIRWRPLVMRVKVTRHCLLQQDRRGAFGLEGGCPARGGCASPGQIGATSGPRNPYHWAYAQLQLARLCAVAQPVIPDSNHVRQQSLQRIHAQLVTAPHAAGRHDKMCWRRCPPAPPRALSPLHFHLRLRTRWHCAQKASQPNHITYHRAEQP